mmetsp:Transcript_22933/g.40585  ORF Transcript_22933/g.40585 Transcript_22933/m.40585 type:complete len:342 (-) Transcript_22933:196-1221(-)|eukprot:CAMPEP_0197516366 /NCGR_PEP_ID=MMETSP1318-20131121/1257_1 /TAXON_ID=552666 /ORGANISM="Partenskyella glossopodia, Strain RCC365" /LENGTH=341 /DNA_ID=CAMNT_0043065073 /DNA_START=93 /DNA_END=1118 /DNA_ORIENTATION=-
MGIGGSKESWKLPPVTFISPLSLYNELNDAFTNTLVFDIRVDSKASASRIDLSATLEAKNPKSVGGVLKQTICEQRMKNVHVVVVGWKKDNLKEVPGWFARGVNLYNTMATTERGKNPGIRKGSNVSRVSILDGGFESFAEAWPMMCSEAENFQHGRIYPNCIWEQVVFVDRSQYTKQFQSRRMRVYVSNYGMATDPQCLKALGIDAVVNCTPDVPFAKTETKIQTLRVPVIDVPEEGEKLYSYLSKACDFVDENLNIDRSKADKLKCTSKSVLIHCKHGQSRSVAVAVAWYMRKNGLAFKAAFERVREARRQARTKFEDQLLRWHVASCSRDGDYGSTGT